MNPHDLKSDGIKKWNAAAGLFLALVWASSAFAWSSTDCPLFDDIHQMAIDKVFAGKFSSADLQILKSQQSAVDTNQAAAESYEHAMTGLVKKGDTLASNMPVYIAWSESFVRSNLTAAVSARISGATNQALVCLGQAIHTLQDATSPAHEGFQPWSYNEGFWAKVSHVFKERIYPDEEKDKTGVLYKNRLEGAVRWAYAIYQGKEVMPNRFFNQTNGNLLLPAEYLNQGAKP